MEIDILLWFSVTKSQCCDKYVCLELSRGSDQSSGPAKGKVGGSIPDPCTLQVEVSLSKTPNPLSAPDAASSVCVCVCEWLALLMTFVFVRVYKQSRHDNRRTRVLAQDFIIIVIFGHIFLNISK